MGKVVLDTSAWVEFERRGDKLKELNGDDELIMSPVALGELLVATRMKKRSESAVAASIDYIKEVLLFATVVAVDDTTARIYADLKAASSLSGTPRGTNDLWIAATAVQHEAELLSYDRRANFAGLPKVTVRD